MTDEIERLSLEEVGRLLGRLRQPDLLRLAALARLHTTGMPRRDPADLLSEALARVLSGQRPWPAAVGLTPFLAGVMRSIAHQWRHEDQREPLTEDTLAENSELAFDTNHELADLMERMRAALVDDPVALGVFEHSLLQTSRTQVMADLGLDATAFDTARRRMIRKLHRRFYPGWNDDHSSKS
jgi:DNA-directed RNA polymerase specialized sigma24 family protein